MTRVGGQLPPLAGGVQVGRVLQGGEQDLEVGRGVRVAGVGGLRVPAAGCLQGPCDGRQWNNFLR